MELRPSPSVVYAECGTEVTLNCEVPPLTNDLSVKHMGWSLKGSSLCSVDTEGKLSTHRKHSPRPFHCSYTHGHLSLSFPNVQLLDGWNSTYMCKLRSNKGTAHTETTVQFKGQPAYLLCREIITHVVANSFSLYSPLDPNKCPQPRIQKIQLHIPTIQPGENGVGSLSATRTLWGISVLLAILKQ